MILNYFFTWLLTFEELKQRQVIYKLLKLMQVCFLFFQLYQAVCNGKEHYCKQWTTISVKQLYRKWRKKLLNFWISFLVFQSKEQVSFGRLRHHLRRRSPRIPDIGDLAWVAHVLDDFSCRELMAIFASIVCTFLCTLHFFTLIFVASYPTVEGPKCINMNEYFYK